MSRLWSRYGVRTAAVALLSVGLAGGYYLGVDRDKQEQDAKAQLAAQSEQAQLDYLHAKNAARTLATARQQVAQQEASKMAADAARADAQRVRRANEAASRRKERERQEAAESASPKPFTGPIPASCNEYSGNRKTGCALLLDKGFKIDQMPCLDKLWDKESGWNHKASNPSSGAYGIPQALPGSKMGSVADDWRTNPATQITWGLGYIKGRYGNPCGAWAHSQDVGWY
ncbi:lytic transglycosylase domain-containing protein [Plantactinospora sp. GCM10030261]|uniref:aggregation-promoting factor C-terminal-like domain-containing protein n=1 Tax=Plantactinospora sp. GCM10030261 TaxID=3273420 RepID=UPI00362385C8